MRERVRERVGESVCVERGGDKGDETHTESQRTLWKLEKSKH